MNLEEKQAYYEYTGGWSYKHPPVLDRAIHRRLQEIDPNYFLVWGGVTVIRHEPEGDPVMVRGDLKATKVNRGRLTARFLDAKVQQFCGYIFKLKNGREKLVTREDQIPHSKRKLMVARFEYVDYGRLRWFLIRYLTPEQLVAAGVYTADDVPPEGNYIWRLTVETPDHRYWEPDAEWVEMVAESTFETFNTPLQDLYYSDKEIRDEREAMREEAEANQTCIDPEELLKFTIDNPRHL